MPFASSLLHHTAGSPETALSVAQVLLLNKHTPHVCASVFSYECQTGENLRLQSWDAEQVTDDLQLRCVGAQWRRTHPKLLFVCAFREQLPATNARHWIDRNFLQRRNAEELFLQLRCGGASSTSVQRAPPRWRTARAWVPLRASKEGAL